VASVQSEISQICGHQTGDRSERKKKQTISLSGNDNAHGRGHGSDVHDGHYYRQLQGSVGLLASAPHLELTVAALDHIGSADSGSYFKCPNVSFLQLVLENQSSFIQENNIPAFGAVNCHGFFSAT